MNDHRKELVHKVADRSARVGVIGLGYVGLPLALLFEESGFPVVGFDVDRAKPEALHRGESYIRHIGAQRVAAAFARGRIVATTDFDRLSDCDAVIVCVPTPLGRHREPDLSYIRSTAEEVARRLRPGQLHRPRVHHLPRHDPRGAPAALRGPRPRVREGLLPRLLAGARGPGEPDLPHPEHPQGGGGTRPRLARGRGRPLRGGDREGGAGLVARSGGGSQDPRKCVSRREHRPRQRDEGRPRQDGNQRLGGHRGGEDEALRLHALLPRAGPRRALHPARPVLPHVEGGRARGVGPLHRAGGRDQHRDGRSTSSSAPRAPSTVTARASRGRRPSSWGSATRPTSTTTASRPRSRSSSG